MSKLNIEPIEVTREEFFNSYYKKSIETISITNKYLNLKGLFLTKPFKDDEVRIIYNSYIKYNSNKINKEKILIFNNKNESEFIKLQTYIKLNDLFNTLQINNKINDIFKLKNSDPITFRMTNKYNANIYLDNVEVSKDDELFLDVLMFKELDIVKQTECKVINNLKYELDGRILNVKVMITPSSKYFLNNCSFIVSEYDTIRI